MNSTHDKKKEALAEPLLTDALAFVLVGPALSEVNYKSSTVLSSA